MKTNTTTAEKLLDAARQQKLSLPEVMLRREQEQNETPPETVYEKLGAAYAIMRQAVENSLKEPHRTMGGLIGGEAIKLRDYRRQGKNLCGETVSRAICYAMGILEVSASMGLIVAAPTAGASGVLPGVLIALQEQYDLPEEKMLNALLVASAIGVVVAENAGISGAAGRRTALPLRDWRSRICWDWCATPLPVWWKRPVRRAMPQEPPMRLFPPNWCWQACRRSFPLTRWWRLCGRWAAPCRKACGKPLWAV